MARLKVLIVEDDRSLADVLAYNVRQAGYEVISAYDGQDGLTQAQIKTPDLVILDLMLPVIDGHEVCRRLRADASTKDMMVLMLTAKSEESDQLIGFSLGADDYVTKPFSVKVLLERIKALVRRKRGSDNSHDDVIASQGITIDRRRHRATASGRPLQLTRSEFRLLETLTRQPGRVFERSELIDAALGEDTVVMERTIDVHIRALRRKMADEAELIETVRGVGYRFRDPGAVTEAGEEADFDHAGQN
ncbi:response regulator [Blastopirellula retiformator]|uniref:Response regulator ArlR n=1 Tax=Blastopirellula retiformator TaxID=2527970 RepID=A0A5C5UUP9_9BACT|nr:response regulator [Blastopirellula retiformator]TWT29270.1 Response regulator ArlR [Blastopirellula retiformator]